MLLRPPLIVVRIRGVRDMGNGSIVDIERYFRRLDLLSNRLDAANAAIGREHCRCRSVRGRGNVIELAGVEVARFGHMDSDGVADALRFADGLAEMAWSLGSNGYVLCV